MSSSLIWVVTSFDVMMYNLIIWGLSSAGRASALQAEGHRFEPYRPHNIIYAAVAELADARDLKSNGWIVKFWQIFLEKSRILKFHI